jgi:thiosulfate/3-mercaptopyruvate sulfurtransferase
MSLISADALHDRIDDPQLRLADVRWWLADPPKGRRDYDTGHIPGAVFVDLDTDLVASEGPGRHPLPEPVAFLRRMESLGFDVSSRIVAYDDAGGTVAARLWWMLDDLGHHQVQVLDGGIGAWVEAGGQLMTTVPTPLPGRLGLRERWSKTIDQAALIARLGSIAIVDARAHERYRGDIEPIDPVAGHIPTALSRPTAGNIGPDGRLLPAEQLRARFEALGGPEAPGEGVVVACGSGVKACHNALAMRVAGLPDPLLYPGSYSDWSRSGLPVATGDDPGEVPPTLRR